MRMLEEEGLELTVIMPCRNEVHTLAACIGEALEFLHTHNIRGEILVVDNASQDGSAEAAAACGARVVKESAAGYGNALRTGIQSSRGRVLIMGDCDATYDFLNLEEMYGLLAEGRYDMVIGNRFAETPERGAMPLSHRLGVRFLSFLGRRHFHTEVYDFHCGLRGLTRAAAKRLTLCTEGMEFATEMIAAAAREGLAVGQTPVRLRVRGVEGASKLRAVPDGFRHLKYILKRNTGRKISYKNKNGRK